MSLIANIKGLCKLHKTSISKIEKELRFGNGTIYKWNKGSEPGIDKIQKVAEYFNVSIEFLLYGVDKHEPFSKQTILKLAQDSSVSIGQVITILDDVKSEILNKAAM